MGFLGVQPERQFVTRTNAGRYAASITREGATTRLGIFDTPEEAAIAYNAASLLADGDFACPSELGDAISTNAIASHLELGSRRRQLLQLLAEGRPLWEVQDALGLSHSQFERDLRRICASKIRRENIDEARQVKGRNGRTDWHKYTVPSEFDAFLKKLRKQYRKANPKPDVPF